MVVGPLCSVGVDNVLSSAAAAVSFVDGIVVTPSLHLSNLMQNWV